MPYFLRLRHLLASALPCISPSLTLGTANPATQAALLANHLAHLNVFPATPTPT